MENWFDLHLYLANWGSRRLMVRWPARLVDCNLIEAFLGEVDGVELRRSGQNLILDVVFDEVVSEDRGDGSGCVAALAPLRADVLGCELRLFMPWRSAIEHHLGKEVSGIEHVDTIFWTIGRKRCGPSVG